MSNLLLGKKAQLTVKSVIMPATLLIGAVLTGCSSQTPRAVSSPQAVKTTTTHTNTGNSTSNVVPTSDNSNTSNTSITPTTTGPAVAVTDSTGNTVNLPVFTIAAKYGLGGTSTMTPPTSVNLPVTIPASDAGSLAMYWLSDMNGESGMFFLAPKGWTVKNAAVGADGSEAISLVSPTDSHDVLNYTNDGGDAGETMTDIASYFPDKKSLAMQGMPLDNVAFANQSQLNSNVMSYTLQDGTNGLAAYTGGTSTGWGFQNETIQLPSSQHELETTILNFFMGTYNHPIQK